jgi:hypothetical protein
MKSMGMGVIHLQAKVLGQNDSSPGPLVSSSRADRGVAFQYILSCLDT